MRYLRYSLSAALGIVLVNVCAVGAQQQPSAQQPADQSSAPIPAYDSSVANPAGYGDSGTSDFAPDTRPLAGAQYLSLGAPAISHSYWQPHFSASATADSNPVGATASNIGWTAWTSLYGGIDLHRIAGNSDMALSYTGGGMISNESSVSDEVVQGLSFRDTYSFHRVKISFLDQLDYLPESSYGFGGVPGVTVPGTGTLSNGSLGLGTAYVPGQSILTGEGQSLTNSFVTQINTLLTPRSSFTLVGGYSLLDYFDENLLNAGIVTASAGYSYQWTRKDTVAVSYSFSAIRYSNFDQPINTNIVEVSYGRRVTGKLAFQISGGPEFVTSLIAIPTSAGSAVTTTATSNTTQLYWTLNTGLQYQMRRAALSAFYSHWVTEGSGVLAGAVTDNVTGSVHRQLTRTTGGGINFGYSRNTGLDVVTLDGGGTVPSSQTYDYWFAGANINRPLSRTLSVNLSYQAQFQNSTSSFCIGPTCGTSYLENQISVGLGWNSRLIPF
ncbi:MAG: hypothetical protein ABSA57_19175 [Candidatus Acidiferrales bacterium]|jgi:hypothetical protein